MPTDLFISYSSLDARAANAVCATLEQIGLSCWMAPRDILPGQAWSEAIIDGINGCEIMLLLYSAASNASPQVLREVERAVSKRLGLLAFRIEDVKPSKAMEYLISVSHWQEAHTGALDAHLQALIVSVQALLSSRRQGQEAAPSVHTSAPAMVSSEASSAIPPNNLPRQLTSFIGRAEQKRDIQQLLISAPLLTLLGPGGAGKTRLSLQVAEEVLTDYPDGVWQVELAALSDAALAPQEMARVLGIKEEAGTPLLQTLTAQLQSKHMLLLLDNCEHLLAACAQLANSLLRACPNLRILATSREALNVPGEQMYRVPSLTLPDPKHLSSPESLNQYEAVKLFVDRALLVQSAFTVTNANAPALAQICHQLDGIPLAIELAANRVKAMPLEQIAQRLDSRFRLLTGGSRALLPRQQTLKALIDWSYDLLDAQERALFCRCSVFAGGWTLEAAEQVCAGESIEDWEILDLMTALADKSLIVYEEREGEARYRMLETLRQYAVERLAEEDPDPERWRKAHRDYFLKLALQGTVSLSGPDSIPWLERFERENDNFRQAIAAWHHDPEGAERELELVGAMQRFWETRGYLTEGRSLLIQALSRPEAHVRTPLRADVCVDAGDFAKMQGDYAAATQHYAESLEIRRELGDRIGIANSLNNLGQVALHQGDYEADRRYQEESLTIYKELGFKPGIAGVLQDLGNIAHAQGDHDTAEYHFTEALALRREERDARKILGLLSNLGVLAQERGDYKTARANYDESLRLAQEFRDKYAVSIILFQIGSLLRTMGEYESARQSLEESLDLSQELGDKYGIALANQTLGHTLWALQEHERAGQCLREALRLFLELGCKRDLAYSMEYLASLERSLGRPERAVRLYAATDALRQALGTPIPPHFRQEHEETLAQLRIEMGEEPFAAGWAEGTAMTLEAAVAYALEADG